MTNRNQLIYSLERLHNWHNNHIISAQKLYKSDEIKLREAGRREDRDRLSGIRKMRKCGTAEVSSTNLRK